MDNFRYYDNVYDAESLGRALIDENEDTIEFRLFRGTLRYNTFMATLQLVDEICNAAISLSDREFERMAWSDFDAV